MKIVLILTCIFFTFSTLPLEAQILDSDGKTILIAKKKKRKKKKRKKKNMESFGAEVGELDESGSGMGVHRDQEGMDAPYWAEINGGFSYSSQTTSSGDSELESSTLGLGASVLFVMGSFGIGPDISYSSSESDQGADSKYSSTNTTLGGGGKIWFGSIDRDLNVPFASFGLGIASTESKSGDSEASKTSGIDIKFGGGIHLFLDSNLSLTPQAEYIIRDRTSDAEGAEAINSSILRIVVGLSTFI